LFYRFPEPESHRFILEFVQYQSFFYTGYTEANKPVAFFLDLMKLNVPELFCEQQGHTSVPGERFKRYLHQYVGSTGLSKELFKYVDTIMVSCGVIQSITTLLV